MLAHEVRLALAHHPFVGGVQGLGIVGPNAFVIGLADDALFVDVVDRLIAP